MPSHLGLLEVECDAPSYPIVRACRKLGFKSPEDVRWCRKSHLKGKFDWIRLFTLPGWRRWLGKGQAEESFCSCGHILPGTASCSFSFRMGAEVDMEISQCPRCRTIYWETT